MKRSQLQIKSRVKRKKNNYYPQIKWLGFWWYLTEVGNSLTIAGDVDYHATVRACEVRIVEYLNYIENNMRRERKPKYYNHKTHTLNIGEDNE